jgi:6-pyruvoyltetrahydropterin/6-carboxytetrahydropterin synthase
MFTRLPTIRVTKNFHFEMAHALSGYDGPCRHIHGHSYKLAVTVSGKPLDEPGHPLNGMVMDFSDIKSIVQSHVVEFFDHALVLSEEDKDRYPGLKEEENIIYTTFQPTCEMLLIHFTRLISRHLPPEMKLQSVRLTETPSSYAEWHADENP